MLLLPFSMQKGGPASRQSPLPSASGFGRILDMRDALEAVPVPVLLGGAALEIVHMAVTDLHLAAGTAAELMVVAVVGVGAEGHLVIMVAVCRGHRLAGDGSKAVAMGIAIVSRALDAALHLMQMELRGAAAILTHSDHLCLN